MGTGWRDRGADADRSGVASAVSAPSHGVGDLRARHDRGVPRWVPRTHQRRGGVVERPALGGPEGRQGWPRRQAGGPFQRGARDGGDLGVPGDRRPRDGMLNGGLDGGDGGGLAVRRGVGLVHSPFLRSDVRSRQGFGGGRMDRARGSTRKLTDAGFGSSPNMIMCYTTTIDGEIVLATNATAKHSAKSQISIPYDAGASPGARRACWSGARREAGRLPRPD